MAASPSTGITSHNSLKFLASKSVGSSLSVPVLTSKHKNVYGEEKFKVSVDKRATDLYMKLLQNRVNKLKREEYNKQKELESLEKLRNDQKLVHERKLKDIESAQKDKEEREKIINKIKVCINKSKAEHQLAMHTIKQQSSEFRLSVNTQRKVEKINHLRIKSLFIESSKQSNFLKANAIREKSKMVETERAKHWNEVKKGLRSQYLASIEKEKLEKSLIEKQMKSLEDEEAHLLQKLGKSSASMPII